MAGRLPLSSGPCMRRKVAGATSQPASSSAPSFPPPTREACENATSTPYSRYSNNLVIITQCTPCSAGFPSIRHMPVSPPTRLTEQIRTIIGPLVEPNKLKHMAHTTTQLATIRRHPLTSSTLSLSHSLSVSFPPLVTRSVLAVAPLLRCCTLQERPVPGLWPNRSLPDEKQRHAKGAGASRYWAVGGIVIARHHEV